jgi:hypothetical protein
MTERLPTRRHAPSLLARTIVAFREGPDPPDDGVVVRCGREQHQSVAGVDA